MVLCEDIRSFTFLPPGVSLMQIRVTEVNTVFSEGETLLFHFDYGDDWMFHVTCEKVETTKSRKRKPEILEVEGDLPEQYPDYEEECDRLEDEDVPKNIVAFNPKTNERISVNPSDEEDDYEAMANRISSANEKLIAKFATHLMLKNLSLKTIDKHCSNIRFYGNITPMMKSLWMKHRFILVDSSAHGSFVSVCGHLSLQSKNISQALRNSTAGSMKQESSP